MTSRQVTEGTQAQGVDEKIIYAVDTTPWGTGSLTNIGVAVKDASNGLADVTATVTSGSVSETAGVITLPKLQSLTQGTLYRVEVKWDLGGNTLECYFFVRAEL